MKSTSFVRYAVVVGLVATASTPGRAQQQESEFTSWRIPGWSFTPSLTAGMTFDSNVALRDAPSEEMGTQGDSLFLFAPSGQLEYLSARTDFSAGYRGHMRRYFDLEELDGFDQRVNASFRYLATKRLTVLVRNSFMDVPTTDETELNGVPFTRTGSRTNRFATGSDLRLTKFTTLSGQYELTWVEFDREDAFLTGGWLNAVRGALSRQFSQRLSAGAEYSFRWADLDEGARELSFQDVGGILSYQLGRHTVLSAGGGFSRLDDRSLDEIRTGPYVRVGLAHQTGRAMVGTEFERSFVPSFGFGGSTQSQQIRGWVHMPITQNRAYVQGSATWRRSEPFEADALALDTVWLRSTVGYAVVRWLRVEGFYNFTRQDSEVTGGEVDRHRVGVQIVLSQPMRIR